MAAPNKTYSKISSDHSFLLASWNIQGGIQSAHDTHLLLSDFSRHKIDVVGLQETRCGDFQLLNEKGLLICLAAKPGTPPHLQYGQGFYVSPSWIPYYYGVKQISNRISIIQFQVNGPRRRKVLLSIINVYAPTSARISANPAEGDQFYEELTTVLEQCNRTSYITFILGDFNSKLGLKHDPIETFMGSYGKGTRNRNGHLFANFLAESQYYASNTTFQHHMRHRSTWYGRIARKHIYNQIDYILIPLNLLRKHPGVLKNSRSHDYTEFPSDHKLLITTLLLRNIHKPKHQTAKRTTRPYDLSKLALDPSAREAFQHAIATQLASRHQPTTPNEDHNQFVQILQRAAIAVIPNSSPPLNHHLKFANDAMLTLWAKERKQLTRKLRRHPSRHMINRYKKKSHNLTKQIHHRVRYLQNQKIQHVAQALEENKGNKKAFEALRLLRKSTHTVFHLVTATGERMTNPVQLIPPIDEWYQSFFNQEGIGTPEPFSQPASPLTQPITIAEVHDAATHLNNNRACGDDDTPGEFYKYGGTPLHEAITMALNKIFETNQPMDAVCSGILIPLNKPGKQPIASNTRPITLLNSIRKLLSNIVFARIYPILDNFISPGQSGFRKNRSTSDVLWSYRFLMAYVQKCQDEFHVMGIDLSKAFDCINRDKLLQLLKTLVPDSDYRILQYLLSHTFLATRIQGQYGKKFQTTIGTPQGDALSPILFTIYLESALRHHMSNIPTTYTAAHNIVSYADDTYFISNNYADHFITSTTLPGNLLNFNLQMNSNKTEHITLNHKTCPNLSNTVLGSKAGNRSDISYRILQSNLAFGTLWKVWLNKPHITLHTKLRMYNATIKPVLTYNLSCLAVPDYQLQLLNSAPRKQLRKLLGIFYPRTISNARLYKVTQSQPLQVDITSSRLTLLGHILRSDINTPANQVMLQYFSNPRNQKKHSGRQPTTLPELIHRDLQLALYNLRTQDDFLQLRQKAQDRAQWRQLVNQIILQTKTRCYQELAATETRHREQRRKRTQSATLLYYTDEEGQRKRMRLTLSTTALYIRLPRRPREPDNDEDHQLERPPNRRRLQEAEPDIYNRTL